MTHIKKENANAQDIAELKLRAEFVGETNPKALAVNRKVRERYSLSDELAIMRKSLALLNIHYDQLDEYNDYVEQCKQEVEDEEEHRNSD